MDDMNAKQRTTLPVSGIFFQYLGYSGALTDKIKEKQVPKMQKSQAVLISAGGNDAHLGVILNYCVFQWETGRLDLR